MRLIVTILLVLLPVFTRPAAGQAIDTVDLQLWTQVIAILNPSANWRIHLEEQPRWNDNISQSFQILTRTGVGRRINGRLTLWAGHAWIAKPPGPGVAHEQRLWQQASITPPTLGKWAPAIRLRLEQRWQDGWADNSHRIRIMGRFVHPFTADARWSLATSNEAMITLDGTDGGPPRGFDQNRVFGGVLYRFSPHASLEVGGMWVATRVPDSPRRDAYLPFVWLNLTY